MAPWGSDKAWYQICRSSEPNPRPWQDRPWRQRDSESDTGSIVHHPSIPDRTPRTRSPSTQPERPPSSLKTYKTPEASRSVSPQPPDTVVIPCKLPFKTTKLALETAVPALDTKSREYMKAGDNEAARKALEALPFLNSFIVPPRDFGALLSTVYGDQGGVVRALQYEIGNPLTASRMMRLELAVAQHVPIRVVLLERARNGQVERDGHGSVELLFDRPTRTLGRFGKAEIDAVACRLEEQLMRVLLTVAGWRKYGEWDSRRSRL